jgi:hypothetical protein
MTGRFAIYYAPAETDPLWARANAWYARPGNRDITVSARRYGFHATIKQPMALAEGRDRRGLVAALEGFTRINAPVPVGPIALRSIGGGFLALVPDPQSNALTAFAARVVEAFEAFRAPLSDADRARRLPGLGPRQVALLERYGYPYVMDQFQFHMTLTDRLAPEAEAPVIAAALAHFAIDIGRNLMLDRLVLFHEPEHGAPFARVADFPLTGPS